MCMEYYRVSKKKPIRPQKTKLQTEKAATLWF